jgi:hypothetical protein
MSEYMSFLPGFSNSIAASAVSIEVMLVVLCSVKVLVLHLVSGHYMGPGITLGTTLR